MEIYQRFLVAGFVMLGVSALLMVLGMRYMNLWAEVVSLAVALAGAMILFRGLMEFLQRAFGGELKKK